MNDHSRLVTAEKTALALAIAGTPLQDVLNFLVRTGAEQFEGRAALFVMGADRTRLRLSGSFGLDKSYTDVVDGFPVDPKMPSCGSAAYTGSQVLVRDVALDEKWAPFLDLARRHGIRACWSTPIRSSEGRVLGTYAVYHSVPRDPSTTDLEAVDLLAHTAAVLIERHKFELDLQAALVEVRERELIAVEMNHRVMNSLQLVAGILFSQANAIQSAEARDVFIESSTRVQAIADLHKALLNGPELQKSIGLAEYLRGVVRGSLLALSEGSFRSTVDIADDLRVDHNLATSLGLITTELVINALKHAFLGRTAGLVSIAIRAVGPCHELVVADDGVGLLDRDRLQNSRSHGMKFVERLVQKIGATLAIEDAHPGTRFRVTFPIENVAVANRK